MEENIKYYLQHSNIIKKILKDLDSAEYPFSYFEMEREEFLDVFETRLEISEGKHDKRNNGIEVKGLRGLVENAKKSKDSGKVLCISVNNNSTEILIYTNVSMTETYGFIL